MIEEGEREVARIYMNISVKEGFGIENIVQIRKTVCIMSYTNKLPGAV